MQHAAATNHTSMATGQMSISPGLAGLLLPCSVSRGLVPSVCEKVNLLVELLLCVRDSCCCEPLLPLLISIVQT